MIPLPRLRELTAAQLTHLQHKYADAPALVDRILSLDAEHRAQLGQLEALRADMNAQAKAIGEAMSQGKKDQAEQQKQRTAELKQQLAQQELEVKKYEEQLQALLVQLPNLPHPSVPVGRTPDDNTVMETVGKTALAAGRVPHWELAERLKLIDFQAGARLAGAGFPVYGTRLARLQRALITFFLDRARDAGYAEYQLPHLVNEATAYATGQLPDKEGQMYEVPADGLYLIPTAEVPLTNLWREALLAADEVPLKACAYTPCFRREAGSYGKDVRGLNRLHQFDKVEIVQLAAPERSYEALEDMRRHAQGLLDALGLVYRVLLLCTGDMSFASAKTYDLEVWSPGQQRWLEVSSVSCFEDFQANRLQLRVREPEGKKTRLCHTLNGSALALPRVVAALLETHQAGDQVRIPEALRPYYGADWL